MVTDLYFLYEMADCPLLTMHCLLKKQMDYLQTTKEGKANMYHLQKQTVFKFAINHKLHFQNYHEGRR